MKKNKHGIIMKKLLLLGMMTAFLLTTAASCASPESETETSGGDAEKEKITFLGDSFTFLTEHSWSIYSEAQTQTYVSDMKNAKIKETEQALDCKIEFEDKPVNMSYVSAAVSGTQPYDYAYEGAYACWGLVKAGLFAAFDDLDAIDITDTAKWGDESYRGAVMYKGKTYGAYGMMSRYWGNPVFFGACMFNAGLVNSLNADNPMELLENGAWTYAGFDERAESYTIVDPENPVYAVSYTDAEILTRAALRANGVNIIESDDDGNLSYGYTSAAAFEALDWLTGLNENQAVLHEDGDMFNPTFMNGNAVFYFGMNSYRGTSIQDGDEIMNLMTDVHWIPMPKGPSGDGNSTYLTYALGCTYIINTTEAEDAACVLNYLGDDPYDGGYAEYERANYCFSDESYNNYIYMIENARYDYSNQLSEVSDQVTKALSSVLKGTATSQEALSKLSVIVEGAINSQN